MKHKHIFSKALSHTFMKSIRQYGKHKPFHLQKDLLLTKNEYNNFQKLKYWDLIRKHFDNGVRIGGYWCFTDAASQFINGSRIPRWVMTFNNCVVEKAPAYEHITLEDTVGYYDIPEQWAERAEPAFENEQMSLL